MFLLLLFAQAHARPVDATVLCREDESAWFACLTGVGRRIALCASEPAGEVRFAIDQRPWELRRLERRFPDQDRTVSIVRPPGTPATAVARFQKGSVDYALTISDSADGPAVLVGFVDGKEVTSLACHPAHAIVRAVPLPKRP